MKRVYNLLFLVAALIGVAALLKASLPQVLSGTWAPVAPMSSARAGASAVLLKDGRILITGGDAGSGALASADLFNTDGTISPAPPMNIARSGHLSVVLQDGRVLVAGGTTSGGGAINATEIYDPVANSWSLASTMVEARSAATASLLQDGRVLIAGGQNNGVTSSTLEIFDPAAGTFSFVGTLSSPRQNHAAALLADGRVLIVGGSNGSAPVASVDVYDPAAGSISVAASLNTPRQGHSATTMLDGRVLVAGGSTVGNNGTVDLASTEIYDPSANTFTATTSNLAMPRQGHLAFLLPHNNSILIAGGTSNGTAVASAELFIPWGGSNQSGVFQSTGSTGAARSNAAGSALGMDGLLLVAGGKDASGSALASTELYGFATVKTDQADYAPGQTVTITGSGWQPGETVTLTLVESPLIDAHGPFTAIADANGNISDSSFVVDSHDLLVRFSLTAVGSVSQAQTTFTDAIHIQSVVVGAQSPNPVSPGGSATYPISFTHNGSGADPVTLSVTTGLPTGASASFSPNPVDVTSASTLTITTTGSTPTGTFTFTVKAVADATVTTTGTLVVIKASTTTVTRTVGSSPSVYGTSLTFAATVTGTGGTPTGTVSFFDGGNCATPGATLAANVGLSGGGVANLVISNLSVAGSPHTVLACYIGDTNFGTSNGSISQSITKATVTASVTASDKTYDGTTTATITLCTLSGVLSGDTVTCSAAGPNTFSDKNVGNAKTVTATNISLGGAQAGNYSLSSTSATTTATITAKALTIASLTASAKVYDGTATEPPGGTAALLAAEAMGTGSTGDGKPYTVDSVSAGGSAVGAFADRNVGTAKPVTVTGVTITGTGNGNYTPTQQTGLTANITAKALTITGLTASAKVYDGTTTEPLGGTAALLAAEATGTGSTSDGTPYTVDSVSAGGTAVGAFADRNVGNAKPITVTGVTITGTGFGNYTATQQTGLTANITAKPLTMSGLSVPTSKVYDGTTAAVVDGSPGSLLAAETAGAGTTSDGKPYTGDTVSLTGTATGTYNSKDVATAATVTFGGVSLTGAQLGNYTLTIQSAASATITAKALTYSGLSVPASKVYDGTTTATVSGTAALQGTEAAGSGTTADGKPYAVDTVSITGTATGTYNFKDVATATTVTFGGVSLTGTGNGDYTLTASTQAATITAKALTMSGLSAPATKVYDGTTTAVVSGTAALQGTEAAGADTASDGKPYSVDSVSLTGTATGTYNSKNVLTATTVTFGGVSLTGTGNGDYTLTALTQPATITAKALTITGLTASAKVYDATTTGTLTGTAALQSAEAGGSGTTSDGKPYSGDTVSVTGTPSGTFASANVANGISVSVTGLSLSGAQSGNYQLGSPQATTTANITAKALTVTGLSASNKVYDGTTAATLTGTAALQPAEAGGSGTTSDGKPYSGDTVSVTGTPSGTFASANVANGISVSVTGLSLNGAQLGNYSLTSPSLTANITQATPTVTVTGGTFTYDTTAHAATATAVGVDGHTAVGGNFSYTYTPPGTSTAPTNAGTYSVSASFTSTDPNYANTSGSGSITINKATPIFTPALTSPAAITYGTATVSLPPVSVMVKAGSIKAASPDTVTITINAVASAPIAFNGSSGSFGPVNFDTHAIPASVTPYIITYSYSGNNNINSITDTSTTLTVNKATATVEVAPYTVTYDGNAHTAVVTSITGENGETGTTVGTINVSNTTHTNAATYASDSWSFTGTANYNNIAATTITDTINKATATVVVAPYTVTYDGNSHTATVTSITGVNGDTGATVGAVTLNTTHTAAGTYASDTWSFTGTANYSNIAATTITDTINKATATVVVAPYTVTYDGNAHTAVVTSITGVNGETGATVGAVTLNTTHTAAGTYASDSWSFTGAANYNNIAATTITDTINKATATVVVTPYTVTYNGQPHTAAVTSITGVNGETGTTVGTVDVSNTTHTAAGTYASDTWSFTGTANYSNIAATAITDTINKATATVVVAPYTVTYDGNAHTAAVTSITGVNGETGTTVGTVNVSNTTHTNAATYASDSWSFTGAANYNDIASTTITDTINKADATVVITPYSGTYDALPHSLTGTAKGVGGVDLSASLTFGASFTNVPGGTATWTFTGGTNYNDQTSTAVVTINKANATINVTPYSVTYDGNPHTATATATGVGSVNLIAELDLSHTAHTSAGTYSADYWTFTDPTGNYNNVGNTTITDIINQAPVTITVTDPNVTYDGNPHTATIVVLPSVSVLVTYNGSPTAPTSASVYTVAVTVTDPNYTGIGSGTLTINQATPSITWATPADITYGTPLSSTQLNATSSVPGAFAYAPAAGTVLNAAPAQTLSAIFTPTDTVDYTTAPASVKINVNPATPLIVWNNPADITYGTALGSTQLNAMALPVYSLKGWWKAEGDSTDSVGGNSGTLQGSATYTTGEAGQAFSFPDASGDGVTIPCKSAYDLNAPGFTASFWMQGSQNANGQETVLEKSYGLSGSTGWAFQVNSSTGKLEFDIGQGNASPSFTQVLSSGNVLDGNFHLIVGTWDGGTKMTLYVDGISQGTATLTAAPANNNGGLNIGFSAGNGAPGQYFQGAVDEVQIFGQAVPTGTFTYTPASGTVLNAGDAQTLSVTFAPTDTTDLNPASSSVSINVKQAAASITVTPYSVTYDGNAHTATATATGVGGVDLSVGLTLIGTTHTNAGTYATDAWSFHDATGNYADASGTVSDSIAKANATFTVTPYTVTYDGSAHTATVTSITGVNGEMGATVGTVDVSNTTHTNAGTYASDSWSFTGTANYNNIASTTITDTINKATAIVVVTPYTVTYDGNAHTATVTSITGVNGEMGATVGAVTLNTTHTAAGTYSSDFWSFTGAANYNNIASTTITDTINKATAIVVVTPYTVAYDGNAHTATITSITGVNGEMGATVGAVTLNTTHTAAGTYVTDSWSFTGAANYNNIASTTITDTINKATATVVVTPYTVTYDGQPHTAAITSITGVNGETGATVGTVDVSNTTHTATGTYATDSWSFTGAANYNNIASTTITDTINKATATVVVTPYTVTYDGNAHTATVTSITGVNGEMGATVGAVTLNTTHTAAGTYATDSWSFAGAANYNNIASTTITDTINKATAIVVVTPYTVTYDGNAHTATVTSITGVNGEMGATVGAVTLNTTHTAAGTYSSDFWSFTGAANYNNIASTTITDTINKATAIVVVTPYTVTYDGNAHTATVTSITGVNGEMGATVGAVTLNTTHTAAGTYATDSWSFAGAANYNNIASTTITDTINKATAIVVVTPYTVTYDGNAHTATVTSITGVNGEMGATVGAVTLNTTHTAAGTYSSDFWSFAGAANYNNIASTTITDTINKATAIVVVTPYTVTYDGNAHTATVTSITGVNGEMGATVGAVTLNTTHTAAGTYSSDSWSFAGAANYNNIASTTITDTINKATAIVVVTPYTVAYDGNAHTATITSITGVNGEMGATVGAVTLNTTHTAAGTYSSDFWSFTGAANYNNIASTTITDTINKATATVVVTPYTVTYDGQPHTAAITSITGVNGETGATVGTVDVSNTTHTATGTYATDSWSFTGAANYNNIASTAITDTINKATATVVVTPYTVTYDGNAHTATITSITGVNGEMGATVGAVTLNTTHTAAGTYSSDFWSFTGAANYNNIASTAITDTINKATATVVVTPYTVTYDGNAHTATVTSITGVNGEMGATVGAVTLNTTHTAAGTYSSDFWSFTGAANYNNIGNTTITDSIAKANTSTLISLVTSPSVYDQPITISALVSSNVSTSAPVSEGMVMFTADSVMTPLCTTTAVIGGAASCTTGSLSLAVGGHTITATYVPGPDFVASGSASVPQTVNARHTSVTITSTEIANFATGSVPIDTTVHLQVTVTDDDSAGTPITPTGTFPITDPIASDVFSPASGGNGSCVLSGSGASASCAFTMMPVEADLHELTASYPGDAVHLASTQNADMTVTAPLVSQKVCLSAPFNGTAIPAGSTVWFNAVFQTTGQKISALTHLTFYNQTILVGSGTAMPVPDGMITFDPNATFASTNFDAVNNRWNTTLPTYNLAGKNWLSGMPVQFPSGLAASTAPVTWCGQFDSDDTSLQLGWQWAAAVYSSNGMFTAFDPNDPASYNLNLIGVKAVDDNKADVNYKNSDHAGTPENFLKFVIGGARGGGGGNYTGGYSGAGKLN